MTEQYTEFQIRAIESVKRIWRLYVVNLKPEELESSFRMLPEDFLMIGTGRHEFYKNRNDFLKGMTADQVEARDIQFELQDDWYEAQRITDDVCLVYGGIWIREKSTPGKPVLIDMEGSRFTVVCRDTPGGVQICNVHHWHIFLTIPCRIWIRGRMSIIRNLLHPWQMRPYKRAGRWNTGWNWTI